jgi:hypothetical protein
MKYVLIAIITMITITIACTLPILWIWNGLMPSIFGLGQINFWQALGISILSTLLFKNIEIKEKD